MAVSSENKKVRNATRVVVDGIQFRSKTEGYAWGFAKALGVPLRYEAVTFRLLEKFRYQGKAIRAITHTPDFVDVQEPPRFILEVKGYANDTYPLYQKLLFRHLLDQGQEPAFYLATNQKQVREALALIHARFIK